MFGLDFHEACDLCDIPTNVRARAVSDLSHANNDQIILFNFNRTPHSLGKYLFYLFCTNNILILNPEFRDKYFPDFHDNVPFDSQDGFNVPLTKGPRRNFSSLSKELIRQKIRLVIPTSGSTSTPKLICYSSECIEDSAKAIARSLTLKRTDVALGYLPLSYIFGLSVLHSHLASGSRYRLLLQSERMTQFLADATISHHYVVPSTLNALKKHASKIEFRGKMLAQAGGGIDFDTSCFWHSALKDRGIEFVKMYGQTECGPRITCLRTRDLSNNDELLDTVGTPLANVTCSISPVDSEIIVRSPFVAMGSISGKDFSFKKFEGAWATGDIGAIDPNGALRIVGRKARFAKVQGVRVGLDELELRAEQLFDCECAIVSSKDFIYIVPSKDVRQESLDAFAKSIGIAARYFQLEASNCFKLGANGKKDYLAMLAAIS